MKTLEIRNAANEIKATETFETTSDAEKFVSTINEYSYAHFLFGNENDTISNARYYVDGTEITK